MWYLDLIFLAALVFGFWLMHIFVNWCEKQLEKQ